MSESAKRGREIFFEKETVVPAMLVQISLMKNITTSVSAWIKKTLTLDDMQSRTMMSTWAFKTPTIRNVALTSPYMHDGSVATLEEVVEWYDKGGHPNKQLSTKIRPLNLNDTEEADLVEFMKACTSPTPVVETGRLPADA